MRIPSGTTDQVIYFVASLEGVRSTGLSSFTVYRSRNGTSGAPMSSPTVSEIDSINMPGVYALLLDEDMTIADGNDAEEFCVHISADGMDPITRVFELYRPEVSLGQTLAVSAGVGSANVVGMGDNVLTAAASAADFVAEVQSGLATSAALLSVGNSVTTVITAIAAAQVVIDVIATDTGTTIPNQIQGVEDKVDAVSHSQATVLQYEIADDFIFHLYERSEGIVSYKNIIRLATNTETPRFAWNVATLTKIRPGQIVSVEVLDDQGVATTDLVVATEDDDTNCGVRDFLVISKVISCEAAGEYIVRLRFSTPDGSTYVVTGRMVVEAMAEES